MKELKYLFVFLIVLSFIVIGCEEKIIEENKNNVTFKKIQQFGNHDDAEESIIGSINGFTIDENENVYVADNAFKDIKMFSKKGKLIKKFGKGAGRGPGEFMYIHNIILDDLNNIYVIDKGTMSVTVFDSLNEVKYVKKMPFLPANIVVHRPFLIDIMGFAFTYSGDIIHRYDLTQVGNSEPVKTYCKRDTSEVFKNAMWSGNAGNLIKVGTDIYYGLFYPYEFRVFSENGELERTIRGRDLPELPTANPTSSNRNQKRPSGLDEVVYFPDGIMIILVKEASADGRTQYFDFLDIKSGKIIASIPCKELGFDKVHYIRGDNQGHLYLNFSEPYPHIIKYEINMEF